jgi:outer membrane protein assembly factor BamE (lipoprotein component of BamABCDE complex)
MATTFLKCIPVKITHMLSNKKKNSPIFALRILSIALALNILSGCETRTTFHGSLPKLTELQSLKHGLTKKSDVKILLGPPSTMSTFGPEIWYYIGTKLEQKSIDKPKLIKRDIVEIRFDPQGILAEVRILDTSAQSPVSPTTRITPTAGKQLNVIQQLLGNVGRFQGTENDTSAIMRPGGR